MTLDTVTLSRLQFAFTIGYHIMWPAYSIGIAGFIVLLNTLWLCTGKTVYRDLMRFWIRLFALEFVMGVVTGVVVSYEIGANWSGFSRMTGNVTGPLLMYEALTVFFLEGGFIGMVLFGETRVGQRMYLFSCCMVALGTLLSAFWELAANSWMQTPQGAILGRDKVFHVDHWAKIIFNPSFPYRSRTWCALATSLASSWLPAYRRSCCFEELTASSRRRGFRSRCGSCCFSYHCRCYWAISMDRIRDNIRQLGIGMVSARITEIVLRDERAVIPIGVFNPKFGATLSMPAILGRDGVSQILEPAMTAEELRGLERRDAQTREQADRCPWLRTVRAARCGREIPMQA
jgi:hypothetical protein